MSSSFSLFMNETFQVKLEFKFQHKWIKLSGNFDRKLCEIKGNFRASSSMEGVVCSSGDNQKNNTFKLVGLGHQNRAVQVKVGENVSDAQFCEVHFERGAVKQLYAIAGLEKQDNKNDNPGYDTYLLDLLDLDQPSDPKVWGDGLRIIQLEFLVPDNFREYKNESGQHQLPFYNFNSLKVVCDRDAQTQKEVYRFKGQMVYQDIFCTLRKLLFIQGQGLNQEKDTTNIQSKKLMFPQWQSSMVEQFQINYPILAYKSNKPTDNEIIICNLALNKRQKVISLGKFRFLQFLETGLNPERFFNRGESGILNTTIFFLVELNSVIRVMYYKCFPWPINSSFIDRTSLDLFQLQGEIRIITGSLEPKVFSQYLDPCRLTQEKIKIASMLARNVMEDIQMMLVLQLNDGIFVFNMNKPDLKHPPVVLPGATMVAERMQRGPGESIYFTEISEAGYYQIVGLTFVERMELTRTVLYRLNQNKICQFQIEYAGQQVNENQVDYCFYLIDNEQQYIKLEFVDQEKSELKVTLKTNLSSHPGIRRMLLKAEQTNWEGSILHKQGINALMINQDNSETSINAVSFRIYGYMQKEHEFFEFKDDKTFARKRLGKQPKNHKKKVLSLFNVPWIGRHVYEVEEAGYSYFLIHNEFFSRKIKLMRYDIEKVLIEDQVLIGNVAVGVKLKHTNQYLFFSQNDFTYLGTHNFSALEPISTITQNLQYFKFQRNQMHIELSAGVVAFSQECKPQIVVWDENFKIMESQLSNSVQPEFEVKHLEQKAASSQNFIFSREARDHHIGSKIARKFQDLSPQIERENCLPRQGGFVGLLHWITPTKKTQGIHIDYKLQGDVIKAKVFMTKLKDFYAKVPDFKKVYSFSIYFPDLPTCFQVQEKFDLIQYEFTRDFLVVSFEKHVIFAKISTISQVNRRFRVRFKASRDQKTRGELIKQFISEDQGCDVHFNVLNFGTLSESIIANGIKIAVASEHNILIADKGEVRNNVIQISFANAAMLWCLDENKEVTFVEKQFQFCSHKHFVNTGMMPHVNKSKSQKQMKLSKLMTMNEHGTLMMIPQTEITNLALFRGFSYMALLDVLYMQQSLANSIALTVLDNHTVLQNFNGLTFFEMFKTEIDFLELIYTQVQTHELQSQKVVDSAGQVSDNIWIRQLFWTLNLPLIGKSQHTKKDIKLKSNVMQDLLFDEENSHIIDPFLKLLMLSSEFKLSNLIKDFESFKKVFQLSSTEINTFLEESFFQNQQCSEINNMKWDKKNEILSFGSNTSLLSHQQILHKFEALKNKKKGRCRKIIGFFASSNDQKDIIMPVEVKIVEIEWLSGSVSNLYKYLGSLDDDQIFGNELVKVLLKQASYTGQIVVRIVIPFFIYMIISLYYFSNIVPDVEVDAFMGIEGDRQYAGLRIAIIVFASFFLLVEIRQMLSLKIQYFTNFWNMIYIAANILPIIIVAEHGSGRLGIEQNHLTQLASFQTVILWLMVFYWCRITPELAFYVKMINETIVDIGYFMIMLLLCIMMFANGIYVLNRGTQYAFEQSLILEEESPLFTPSFNNEYLDAIMSQWQLGLGNFYTDPFSTDSGYILCWIYFVLATFFTQITFMNMLIALMGVTFERVSDAKERNALMETTQMYADFLWAISLSSSLEGNRYLYIVKPVVQDDQASNSENSIATVRRQLKILEKRTNASISDSTGRISIEVEDLNKKVQNYFKNSQQVAKSLTKMQNDVVQEMKATETRLNEKLEKILKVLNQK